MEWYDSSNLITTGNWGKVTYYTSGSITHKLMTFLYLDYITTNFQYDNDNLYS